MSGNRDPIFAPDGRTWYDMMLAEAEKRGRLEAALRLAREYGIASQGFDARESYDLGQWVDAGMNGEPPRPRYLNSK